MNTANFASVSCVEIETPHGIAKVSNVKLLLQTASGTLSSNVDHSKMDKHIFLRRSDNSPLVSTLLSHSSILSASKLVMKASSLLGLEVSGPVQFIDWRLLRSKLAIESDSFLKLLRDEGRLTITPLRLTRIESKTVSMTAQELIAFASVYNIDLNKLKPL